MNDLDVAIEANEKPESFISRDHLGHVSCLASLGTTLLDRFERNKIQSLTKLLRRGSRCIFP